MGENKKKRSVSRGEFFIKCVLFILDYFLFLIIIPVCGIAYWVATYYSLEKLNDRKSWTIHLKYILIFSSATIFVIKHVARVAIYKFIRDHVKSTVKFFVVSKLYIYLFAVTSTIFFACFFEVKVSAGIVPIFAKVVGYESRTHSISNASDSQSENDSEEKNEDPIVCIILSAVAFLLLLCLKCSPHLAGEIGYVEREDTAEDVFLFPTTMFKSNWKKNKLLYILDSIFSVFIVGTLVILVWRGAWCLLDHTIYPSNYLISGWISLGIGYSIVFATFALQRLMKMLIRKYHGWMRLVIIDTYVVVSFCGTINIWRGIWILLEVYADLEHSLTNCILLHFLSFFILVIFNSSNTLLVRGVYIDAEENGEDCVEFPCYYFRLRFQERQKKKTLVELKMVNNKINLEDDTTLTSDIKKPETEIVTEINPQQVPLIVNNLQNSNGNLNSKLNNEDDKCNL